MLCFFGSYNQYQYDVKKVTFFLNTQVNDIEILLRLNLSFMLSIL